MLRYLLLNPTYILAALAGLVCLYALARTPWREIVSFAWAGFLVCVGASVLGLLIWYGLQVGARACGLWC